MTARTGPPGKGSARRGQRRAEGDEDAAGGSSMPTLPRPADNDGLPRCGLCGQRRQPAWEGCDWCTRCVHALGEALARRRGAELRLPPLGRAGVS
jgi:hypothetical protein